MTKEELEAAMAAAESHQRQEPARPQTLGSLVGPALPRPEQATAWREKEERRAALERVQVERTRAERAERRKALIAELSTRCEPKLLKQARDKPTLSAVLLGPTGCGKTSAAKLLCVLARPIGNVSHYWITALELSVAQMGHPLGHGRAHEIERARHADVLVIDDVGNERDTTALFEVLDCRYEKGLPVIVTTGLTRAELKAHVGAATVRRMVEQHAGHPVLVVDCHG